MLDAGIKQQLEAYMQHLKQPVELTASLDEGASSQELLGLLEDLRSLSPLITLKLSYFDRERTPSFAVGRPGEDARIRFAGIPLGHEFTSLVLALLQTGGHPPKISEAEIEQIRALDIDCHFETYVSLHCQNCPDVVQALNLMAVLNPRIRNVMIDGALFQEEVNSRNVMAVPTVLLNGEVFGQGRMGITEILAKLDTGAEARTAARLAEKDPFDMLIVGAGPAGAAAAIYAARKGIRTGIAAERFGGQVMDTMGIENFISVKETEGPKLASALEQHVLSYEVDVMPGQRATRLVPAAETGGLAEIHLANGAILRSRSVLLATGARWREMNVPGEREYRGKGVAYCPHCDGPLFKGKRVAVIGGGNSGIEAAIDLAGIVAHVTVLEFDNQLRADAVLQRKLYSLPNVTVITSAQTTEVTGDGQRVNGITVKDRTSGEIRQIALEGIFVQIGLVPNTDWLKGVIDLTPRGEIIVDDRGQTSVAGVFAAGDVTTTPFKQIIIAMGDGAKAALGAFDHLIRSSAPADKAAA